MPICARRRYNERVRLLTLLRLPYQLQLGPIFAWGFLLNGGRLTRIDESARFLAVFLLFHIGAFGGLTALNSWYDRDVGPIGGLWNPPPTPSGLFHFAWLVQLGGLALLLPFGFSLVFIYASILLLSLGYSHPRTRWKGHPWKSIAVVALGQGVLDCAAGAFIAMPLHEYSYAAGQEVLSRFDGAFVWSSFVWLGMLGATLTVTGFYPLTQLYQIADDARKGDYTIAAWLFRRNGRRGVFVFAFVLLLCGALFNVLALQETGHLASALLLGFGSLFPLMALTLWSREREVSTRRDFQHVHGLMRGASFALGVFLLWLLARGGLFVE